jgi:hypothetical protein
MIWVEGVIPAQVAFESLLEIRLRRNCSEPALQALVGATDGLPPFFANAQLQTFLAAALGQLGRITSSSSRLVTASW